MSSRNKIKDIFATDLHGLTRIIFFFFVFFVRFVVKERMCV